MADYFAGEITIGGNVSAALLGEFLGEVAATCALVGDYEGAIFDAKTVKQLREQLNENGHLKLVDAEARCGRFEELETFLVKHDIPFDRHSDAQYELDGEYVAFRPGMQCPLITLCDKNGDSMVFVDLLRPIAKEMARLATAKITREALARRVARASITPA